jgi:glycosidase
VGSGITVEPWWTGAVLYQIDPMSFQDSKGDGFGDLQGIAQRLDYVQSLGVDAIVLSPFELRPEFGHNAAGPAFDPKYGTEEDLDHLVQEASRHKIRIFVDLPLTPSRSTAELVNVGRFWLSRGIAGLRLTHDSHDAALTSAQVADRLKELHKLCANYAGHRVLFWDMPDPPATDVAASPTRRSRNAAPVALDSSQLQIDSRLAAMPKLDAAGLRQALESSAKPSPESTPVPETDGPGRQRSFDRYGDGTHDVEIAKLLATALLASRGAPLLYFGQEIGMATTPAPTVFAAGVDPTPMQWGGDLDFTIGIPWIDMGRNAMTANVGLEDVDAASLLNWYRRLSALHHENPALRVGTTDLIAESNPDIVAWVRRPREAGSLTPPVVVVCNLTGRSLLVSVAADLRRAGVQPASPMMHTLASTTLTTQLKDPISGPVSMNAIALPPYGVYIGELARQPGLENAPSPLRHSSR